MPRHACRPLVVAVALLAVSRPSPAEACINGVLRSGSDGWTWEVERAEKSLAFADHVAASRRVLELFPAALDLSHTNERALLLGRARRVLALAIARTGGAVPLGGDMSEETAEHRSAKIAWSATYLRARLAESPDDPERQADLAEALAWIPAERPQALELLRSLALADLLPAPRSWALLGAIAAAEGQHEVGRIGATHCRQIASQGHVCDVPPLPRASTDGPALALARGDG